jgi:hypothetical protein
LDYTKINSNDQLDIKALCLSSCSGKSLIFEFNLYQMDLVYKNWTLFTNNTYFYQTGLSNEYLVILKDLFRDFPDQVFWKVELNFELTTFTGEILTASSSMIFYVNFVPINGVCDISPLMGTTSTLFTIICKNWIDKDGNVVSYSYYGKIKVFKPI